MKKLSKALTEISGLVPQYELCNFSISKASVGWHIAHSCLVINSIAGALKKSDPSVYRRKFSFPFLYVSLIGSFPRGKGKAPERVVPVGEINPETLQTLISRSQSALSEIPGLAKNAHFKHPLFGLLNKKSTIRFLEIHTVHHYKIIRDIIG
jgi:hypothetical protein